MDKNTICAKLRAFAKRNPNMHAANYADWRSYKAEARRVTRDLAAALDLIDRVEREERATATMMLANLDRRLTWDAGRGDVEYCAGQYFATEYRKAVQQVCAMTLWQAEHSR